MSSIEPTPSSSARIASSKYGTSNRFTINPVLSCARTGTFPSIAPNSTIASYTAGSVEIVRTTSTNFITGTGLKKCSPTNRSGRFVAVEISVIVSDDVLLAKIAFGPHSVSSFANNSRFAGSCSMIASITRSQSFKSSIAVVPFNRPRISLFCASVIVPFSTNRAKFLSIPFKPFSTTSGATSRTTVSNPAAAQTCAIPDPINPHPTTPTFLIAMSLKSPVIRANSVVNSVSALIQTLNNHRNPLPAPNARRRQTIPQTVPPQFIQQRNHQSRPGRRQRMPQRNRPAIHIRLIAIQSQNFLYRQILRRKRFVHFDAIHLLQRQPRQLQRALRRRHRPNPHNPRIDSRRSPRHNPSNRLKPPILSDRLPRNHNRRRPIHNSARVPRRHNPIFLKRRRQLLQNFHRCLRSPVIVFAHRNHFLPLFHFHRDQLFANPASLVRRVRSLLRPQRIRIRIFARNPLLLRQFLRGHRHRQSAKRIRQPSHQRVFQRAAAQSQSIPRPANHKRRLRHIFHPARQHHRRFAQQNPLRTLRDRLNPRPAQAVHRHRRRLHLQPRLPSHMPRAIERVRAR